MVLEATDGNPSRYRSLDIYHGGPDFSLRKYELNCVYDLGADDGLKELHNMIGTKPNLMPTTKLVKWHWLAKFKFERTKAYARVARLDRRVLETANLAAPTGCRAQMVEQFFQKAWSDRWQSTDTDRYRQTRFWFPTGPRPEVSKELLMKNRTGLGSCIQLLTGHGWLKRHQWIVDSNHGTKPTSIDPMCRLCGKDEETPKHLWEDCSQLRMGTSVIPKGQPWQLKHIDRFLRTNSMVMLLTQCQGEQEM